MPKQTFFNLPVEKRERILEVAIDEFADNDYQNVSISRLVDRAEIAKGSFYQYFEGKEDLYRHLLEMMAQAKREFLSERPPGPEMSIFSHLRWLARESVRFEMAYPRLSQVSYRAVTGDSYPPSFIERLREQSMAYFREMVARAKAQGDIAPEVDEDLAAFFFNTIFTELGRYMLKRYPRDLDRPAVDGKQQTFFISDEMHDIFAQTVTILEKGMGIHYKDKNDEQD